MSAPNILTINGLLANKYDNNGVTSRVITVK